MSKRLIELFHATGSFKSGTFILSSGKESSTYVNCKHVVMVPEALNLICEGFERLLEGWRGVVDAIGGVVIGPDPIVGAMVARSWPKNPLGGFLIRKKAKGHGTSQYIEGSLKPGQHAVLVEDVTTTGGSVLGGVQRVKEFGASVACVLTVVDREEGAREALAEHRLPLFSLLTLRDLQDAREDRE